MAVRGAALSMTTGTRRHGNAAPSADRQNLAVQQGQRARFSAERLAFCGFAIGALLFGASAVEDYLCLGPRSSGQTCGILPPTLFHLGIVLALLLLIGSVVQWIRAARTLGERPGERPTTDRS